MRVVGVLERPALPDRADALVGALVAVPADQGQAVAQVDDRVATGERDVAVGRGPVADQRVHEGADRAEALVLVVGDVGDRLVRAQVAQVQRRVRVVARVDDDVVPFAHRRRAEDGGADHGQGEGAIGRAHRERSGVDRGGHDDVALIVDQVDQAAQVADLAGEDQAGAGRRGAVGAAVGVVHGHHAADVDAVLRLRDRAGQGGAALDRDVPARAERDDHGSVDDQVVLALVDDGDRGRAVGGQRGGTGRVLGVDDHIAGGREEVAQADRPDRALLQVLDQERVVGLVAAGRVGHEVARVEAAVVADADGNGIRVLAESVGTREAIPGTSGVGDGDRQVVVVAGNHGPVHGHVRGRVDGGVAGAVGDGDEAQLIAVPGAVGLG